MEFTKLEIIKNHIKEQDIVSTGIIFNSYGISERTTRKAISELRTEGIKFVPMRHANKGFYKRADLVDIEIVRRFYKEQLAHAKSIYFDLLLPFAEFLEEKEQQRLYAHIDLFKDAEEEEKEE